MTDEVRYRLLDEPILTIGDAAGRREEQVTLPALYAALVRDAVGDFPALRPHQRHVWHAFLVQVGALALHRAGLADLPDDAATWRGLLLGLTPKDADGAAWALVSPPARPALLQPPVPGGALADFKRRLDTPDALDMLVTAKNHDVKAAVVNAARPEHWVFALVSLQTQEGFLGAGNYGVSRMNGGFASRPGFGIAPPGGAGSRVVRDVRRLLALRSRLLEEYAFFPRAKGVGLVWLEPWDGAASLPMSRLDPFYVEVCRRVRLVADRADAAVHAVATGSKAPRIDAKALSGRTGDPWTPLMVDGDGRKALTADAGGLTYRRLVPLLFPSPTDAKAPLRAPLQECAPDDASRGLTIIARALVRGQGKTEGFHERRVPVSRTMRRALGPGAASDAAARVASERVSDAGTLGGKVLFAAALTVYTAAPGEHERKRDDETAKRRAGLAVERLDAIIDVRFFVDLDAELRVLDEPGAAERVRAEWLLRLRDAAAAILDDVLAGAPTAAMRHHRTRVRATRRLAAAFRRHFGERIAAVVDADAPPAATTP